MRSIAVVTGTLLLAPAVAAGSLHCIPDPLHAAPGQTVAVRLVAGAPFEGRLQASGGTQVQRLWNSGRQTISAEGGVASFRADEPGVQLVAHAASDGRQTSYCKALVLVGDPAPGENVWRSELGQRLEIVPRTDPARLASAGGRFEARILFDREPLVGATVVAVSRKGGKEGYRQTYSDARGDVRLDLEIPGPWLVHLAHKLVEPDTDPGWSLFESSIVLDVGRGD